MAAQRKKIRPSRVSAPEPVSIIDDEVIEAEEPEEEPDEAPKALNQKALQAAVSEYRKAAKARETAEAALETAKDAVYAACDAIAANAGGRTQFQIDGTELTLTQRGGRHFFKVRSNPSDVLTF